MISALEASGPTKQFFFAFPALLDGLATYRCYTPIENAKKSKIGSPYGTTYFSYAFV
jgi:hypothetical protein